MRGSIVVVSYGYLGERLGFKILEAKLHDQSRQAKYWVAVYLKWAITWGTALWTEEYRFTGCNINLCGNAA